MKHTGHKNDMSSWPEIRCQRGCAKHVTRSVHVKLGGPTAYTNLPPIPERFGMEFDINVWEPAVHPVDGGPYCAAHDAVSATIFELGVWEPAETIIALDLLTSGREGNFLDLGAQIGWFSVLAATCARGVVAIEADTDNADLCLSSIGLALGSPMSDRASFQSGDWQARDGDGQALVICGRLPLDRFAPTKRIRLAKIDVEGAEPAAVDWLWPLIEAGGVDAMLIELSPVFHDGYQAMAQRILDAGYVGFAMPRSSSPIAVRPGTLLGDLRPWTVADMDPHQENVLFIRPERY